MIRPLLTKEYVCHIGLEKNDIYFQGRKSWGIQPMAKVANALIYAETPQIYGHFKLQPWLDFMLCPCIFSLILVVSLPFETVMRWVN